MAKSRLKTFKSLVAAAGMLMVTCASARAGDPQYNYTLNTSGLNSSDTYYLFYQLDAGNSGTSNQITVDDFGGATLLDVPSTLPPSSANPSAGVTTDGTTSSAPTTLTLDDSSNALVDAGVAFNPGSSLSFTVNSSGNLVNESQFFPDEFSFALLDSSGNNLGTTAPDSSDNLIELTLGYPKDSDPRADYETFDLISSSSVPLPMSSQMTLALLASLFGWGGWRKVRSRRLAVARID